MGYVDQNLMAGEAVVYRTRLHWILFVFPLVVIGFAAVGELAMALSAGPDARLTVLLGLLGVLALLASIVVYLTSEFAVTNKRVII